MQIVVIAEEEDDPISAAIQGALRDRVNSADIWPFPDSDMELASCEEFMTKPLILVACPPKSPIGIMDPRNDPTIFFGSHDPDITVILHFPPRRDRSVSKFRMNQLNREHPVHEIQVEVPSDIRDVDAIVQIVLGHLQPYLP